MLVSGGWERGREGKVVHSQVFHSQCVFFFASSLKIKMTDVLNNRIFVSN